MERERERERKREKERESIYIERIIVSVNSDTIVLVILYYMNSDCA